MSRKIVDDLNVRVKGVIYESATVISRDDEDYHTYKALHLPLVMADCLFDYGMASYILFLCAS